jgi:hypothetical protein
MSGKRGSRGGGAALYAARQSQDVTPTDEEIDAIGGDPDITVLDEHEEPVEEEETEEVVEEGDEPEEDDDTGQALTTMQRQLAEMQAENDRLRKQANDADMDTAVSQQAVLAQALNSAKQRAADAEAAIELASAAGDHKGVAKATAALSKAIQDQDRFELAADEMAAEIEERKKPKPQQPRQQQTQQDDAYEASLKPFSEPSREWLRKHRTHIEGKPAAGEKAQALAMHAIKVLGLEVDTPEFFAHLDKGMGFDMPTTKRAKPAPGRPQTGAPAGNRGGTGRPTEIVLTAAQRQAAVSMGMTLKEYAKSVMEIQKNGQDANRPGLRFSAHTAHSSRR